MGLIRKQIGSDSPKEQVENWLTKYASHPVMFGTFYNPTKVLFKVNLHHSYVMRRLVELYLHGELNEFVTFDFDDASKGVQIKSYTEGPHGCLKFDAAEVMSMMDKHLLNLNEVVVFDGNAGNISVLTIKRYGDGDWRAEPNWE